MSKQDLLKVQTCVLRVHIHCEGCMHKVKKKLQKVDGVYKVSIDSEQGKVVVSGNADPMSLIEKLEKAGKHAELWGPPQKGGQFPIQLNKFQIDNLNKSQKKGNEQHQHQQQQQQQQHLMKNGFVQVPLKKGGSKDEKFQLPKDHNHKSVRFDVPQHEEDDDEDYYDEDDDFDEFDDEEDDEFDDEFGEGGHGDFHGKPPAKAAVAQKPNKAAGNGHKGDKGGGKDGKAKKGGGGGGGGIDMFIKGMLKKAGGGGGKKGKSDKSEKKGEKKKDDGGGGKNGGKKGGFDLGDAKKGKSDDGWSKKAGDNFHGGKHQHQQQGFGDMKPNHKGGGGGGGKNMDMNHMMGQKGGFPAVPGMPAMNGGRFPGAGAGNPYNQQQQQQQYMAQMMMMNQQRENGHEAYHPALAYARPPPPAMSYGPPPGMGYGQPQHMGYGQPPPMSYGQPPPPPMSYGPPPASAEYTHMFSDENTGSCSIM